MREQPKTWHSRLRLRGMWALQLTVVAWRRRRWALVAGCAAFFVIAAAVIVIVSAWTHSGRRFLAGTNAGVVSVELVAFLREDLPRSAREDLSAVLARLPGVARVRALGSDQVLAHMRDELGERAGVLDGVEEGFLPATLEVTLQAGGPAEDVVAAAARADEIAWRLRRMAGITDVDVLRSAEDHQLTQALGAERRLGRWFLGLSLAAAGLGVCLAGAALRRRPSEARLLAGLGFTAAAVAVPGALVGAACAVIGTAAAAVIGVVGGRVLGEGWSGGPLGVPGGIGGRGLLTALVSVVVCGAVLGWWGARPSGREGDEVEVAG